MFPEYPTKEQEAVFAEAKRRLEKKSWYRGVCTDRFPSAETCKNDFESAVVSIVMETGYWDAPTT